MQTNTEQSMALIEELPHISDFKRFRHVFFGRAVVIAGFVVIVVFTFFAIFAPFISPYDPYEQDLNNALAQPSMQHWLGTDQFGRDTFSRIIYGARVSLMVGFIAVGIAALIGVVLGLVTGYFGGWVDTIIMRYIDAQMAIPALSLALAIGVLLGGGLKNMMISLGVAMVPAFCRLMRGQVLSVKETDYVMAARVVGASNLRIMLKHILPNCLSPIIVLLTMSVGGMILAEAGLSFLGLGIEPPGAAWGAMVNDGYPFILTDPLLSFAPGICILLLVLSFNMVGDGLRDALDPMLRGTL